MLSIETKKTVVKVILDVLVFLFISFIVMIYTDNPLWLMLTGMVIKEICKTLNSIIDENYK